MGLKEIRDSVVKAADEFAQGHVVAGGRNLTTAINLGLDIVEGLGFQSTPEDQAVMTEIQNACDKCKAEISKVTGGPVGKLGDGKLLKMLLDAFMVILPLLIKT